MRVKIEALIPVPLGQFTRDPQRPEGFERGAKLLASLNGAASKID